MNEIFLSYARENKAFVRKLYEALSRTGLESWVDWEGIPPSAEWFQEITSAIEAAQAFIFVISPDSVASEVCKQELAKAMDNNKRLIPIVCQEIEVAQVPEALQKLNWVFFHESDDFDESFKNLLKAIETDLEWVRSHTRLLVRAREWDSERHDKSFTLRGRDLSEAEEWLAKGTDKEPNPTGLQTQYILFSRKVATRRQTITLTAVLIGFVIATLLAVVAYYQYTRSEERRKIALSRQLAAQATNHLDDQLDVAGLLSVEAYRTRNTIEARSVLFKVVQHNPRLTTFLHGHTAGVLSITISPDGRTLGSGGWDNTIRFWDVDSGQTIGSPYTGHANYVRSVAFSPDGTLLASGSCADFTKGLCRQGEIRLIDVKSRRLIGSPFTGHTNWVHGVTFSPDGKLLASAGSDNTIRLWDVATGQPVFPPLTGHKSWVVSVAFSPDGNLMASASRDQTIRLWDVATGQMIGSELSGHASGLTCVAFNPNGDILASGSSDDTVRLWDVANGVQIGEPLYGHKHLINGVAFSSDGRTLLSASRDGTIIQWNVASRKPVDPPLTGHTNEVLSVAFTPDGTKVASGDRDGGIVLWNPANLTPLAKPLSTGIAPVSSIVYTPDGTVVSLGGRPMDGWDELLAMWDVAKRRPIRRYPIRASILSQALSPDGRLLATSERGKNKDGESSVILWDVATGRRIGSPLVSDSGYIESLAFNREGMLLAAGNEDGSIILWEISTHRQLGPPLKGHTKGVEGLAFSPDDRVLASSSDDNTVRLWDLSTKGALGKPLVGHTARVTRIVFSPDSGILASSSIGKTSNENAIILWDVKTRQMVGSPLDGQRGVMSLAFSADGQMLAAANDDGTVSLFDVAAGKPQPLGASLSGHASNVNAVDFSPSSPWLVSAGGNISSGSSGDNTSAPDDGTIVRWDMSIESWINRVCRRANRNLSPEEWTQFLGEEPYRRTCLE